MQTILVIGTFEAVFLFFLLLGKKNRNKSDNFLGIIFLLYAFSIGLTYLEEINFRNGFPFPFLINLSWLLLFLHGPALWFYIKSLVEPAFKFRAIYLLHFIPFVVFLIIHYLTFIQLPAPEKIILVETDLFRRKLFYNVSVIAIGISSFAYNIWALHLIQKYRKQLKQNLSKIEGLDLNWLRVLTILAVVLYSVNVILFNLDLIFHYASYQLLMLITYSFASIYILVLGYFGLSQGNIFISLPQIVLTNETKNIHEYGQLNIGDNEFVRELLSFMEHKQPYLDPELTLAKLSDQLNVKPEILSEVLNSQINQNFFDFVNKYRIEEFKIKSLMKEYQHLSILGIAFESGFNSKAAFYRAFKKFEGISPSDYIGKVSNKTVMVS